MSRLRQRGVILLSALILTALAAIVAATLFFDTAMAARRSVASFSMEQALELGRGAEALAAYAIGEDRDQDDSTLEEWAQPYGPLEVAPEVSLEAQVTDQQGRFNLNTLIGVNGERDEDAYKVFRRLLQLLEMDTRWAGLLVDWLDPNVMPSPEGGEDSLYMSRRPPHRVANMPLTSISELQQLPDFDLRQFERLKNHVTALPPSVRTVNVCTADGFLLDALYAVTNNDATHVEYSTLTPEQLTERRANGCFPRRTVLTGGDRDMQEITAERTSWMRLQTVVRIGTAQFALYSLMYRDATGRVRAVTRSFGTEEPIANVQEQDGDL